MNGSKDEIIEKLRTISNQLDADLLAKFKNTYFPGWDFAFDGEQGCLIREAAKGILAKNISKDEGTYVSQKSIAALLHYVADMMEEI